MTNGTPDTSVFRPGLLDGQVALVTGGGTGIGYGVAELLGALGAHVVLASRKAEHLDRAAEQLRGAGARASTAGRREKSAIWRKRSAGTATAKTNRVSASETTLGQRPERESP